MARLVPRPISLPIDDPIDLARRWPLDRPLAMLRSPGKTGAWSRWSILAAPVGHLRIDRHVTWTGTTPPPCPLPESTDDPMALLEQLLELDADLPRSDSEPPFRGGWIAVFHYELGHCIEPAAGAGATPGTNDDHPFIDLLWCPTALVHDRTENQWWSIGGCEPPPLETEHRSGHVDVEPARSTPSRETYIEHVQRIRDFIHAGDVFQVNLSRRLRSRVDVDPRELAARALCESEPRYGIYIELPGEGRNADRAILSMSPELFLQVEEQDGTRTVITRPIKGTRPAWSTREELEDSVKDAAELHMIVDLMRNDLGRVCRTGSVTVDEERCIETHPTVHHGVGQVHGTLREDASLVDLLRASFPAGSITGAPKIRAMQIIDELEGVPRGPYCGALGWISGRDATFSVGIRTLAMEGRFSEGFRGFTGTVDYGTGGGIVSDSDPESEFDETCHKAAVFENALEKLDPVSG